MKKTTLFLSLLVILSLLAVSVYLCIEFFSIYQSSTEGIHETSENLILSDPERFVQEQWQVERTDYDGKTLTLYRSYAISYAQACKLGGNIFTEDLAPESYIPFAKTVAADVSARFYNPKLVVVFAYLSEDGEIIFSADSEENIFTCWDTKE